MPQLSLIPKIRSSPKKLPSKKMPLEEIKAEITDSGKAEKMVHKTGEKLTASGSRLYEDSKGQKKETKYLNSVGDKERLNDSRSVVGDQVDESFRSYKQPSLR